MKVYKLTNQTIKELFIIKGNRPKEEQERWLDSVRLEFISLCQKKDDYAKEYLTPDRQKINGDLFKEVDIPGGHLMFFFFDNRLDPFPELKKELLRIIGEIHRFEGWEE
jgi:hypothetical protein